MRQLLRPGALLAEVPNGQLYVCSPDVDAAVLFVESLQLAPLVVAVTEKPATRSLITEYWNLEEERAVCRFLAMTWTHERVSLLTP